MQLCGFNVGLDQPFFLIAGTCSIEGLQMSLDVAGQLKASEQQYRMLFDEHPHPMWVHDRETLQLQAVNRSMERHYGYTESELLTMSMLDLWPAARRPNVAANIRAVPMDQRNKPVISRHIKKDGSFMDVEITAGSISPPPRRQPWHAGHRP